MESRKLKLGIAGIGVGASEILPAMEQIPEFELVAAADVNPRVLETFRQRYGAKTYDSVEKMCADPDVQYLTWQSYMHKELVRRKPVAHAKIFVKDMGHLLGLSRA